MSSDIVRDRSHLHRSPLHRHPDRRRLGGLRDTPCAGGGLTATACVAAARLGSTVELWAIVGDDYHGKMIRQELAAEQVDVRNVRLVPGGRTPSAFIEVDSRPVSVASTSARLASFLLRQATWDSTISVRGARALLVDGLYLATDIAAASVARASGGVVVADISRLDGPNAELVPLVTP